MAYEFKLPDIGEGLTEGEVVKWLVKEGEAVAGDQPMVEVMTDKATVEITVPRAGTISKILAAEGETIPVGAVMVVIDDGGAAAPAAESAASEPEPAPTPTPAPATAPTPAPPRAPAPARPPVPARAPAPAPAALPAPVPAAAGPRRERTLAAPATRRLARTLGVDLDAVPATGEGGRVTREDVERFAAGGATAPLPPTATATAAVSPPAAAAPALPERPAVPAPTAPAEDEVIVLRGMRGKIAEQMVRSKQFSPHFTFVDECDMTEVAVLRAQAKAYAAERGVKLTYLPFIIKALVQTLKKFPSVNSLVDDSSNSYIIRSEYNVGLATDTEAGLMVPVVKHADRRSLLDLAAEIQHLTTLARAKRIALEDLKGGTISITSAGSIGGILATPILNYPEVAILGVYKIKDRPVVRDGEIVVRKMTNFSITLDHRIVDGATAARFLNEVIRLLETPGLMLLEDV